MSPTGTTGTILAQFFGGSDQICDERSYVLVKAKMLEGSIVVRAGGISCSASFEQQIQKQLTQWNVRSPAACSHVVAAPKKARGVGVR